MRFWVAICRPQLCGSIVGNGYIILGRAFPSTTFPPQHRDTLHDLGLRSSVHSRAARIGGRVKLQGCGLPTKTSLAQHIGSFGDSKLWPPVCYLAAQA